MSLLKTAFACVLLAVLAPQASAQTIRPATSRNLGQYSGFGGSPPTMRPAAMNGPTPIAGPAILQSSSDDSPAADSGEQAWASDSPVSDAPDYDSPESVAPQYDAPDRRITHVRSTGGSTWSATPPPGSDFSQAGCQGNCSDGSPSAVSSWLGTYRFGGGNSGFTGPWYVSADAFLLQRSNGNANIPITVDSNTGTTLLSAQNLKFTSAGRPTPDARLCLEPHDRI